MKYKSSDLAIIIPAVNERNIKICLRSIKKQSKIPGQTIIVFNKKKNFKSSKNFIFSYVNISNQVYQRNHGLKLINKKIKLILQLDDKFYLQKKAIENLLDDWNKVEKKVAGIGIKSNFQHDSFENLKFLKYITLTGSNDPGKVLISGFNNKLISKKRINNVDWLQGGLSSWRLKYVPNIFSRKFPLIKWSILEDLIFSFDIKTNKKFRLIMSNGVKAYFIKNKNNKFSIKEYYYRGFENARMHKVFVYLNKEQLSKVAFFYSYITSSILGILWSFLKIDIKLFFYFGRLIGILADTKKIKVL